MSKRRKTGEGLPDGWEAFRAFISRDDVRVPLKPFLPVLLSVWECGYRREMPPEWLPLVELKRLRETPHYDEIIDAERRHGKFSQATLPAAKEKPKK